MYIHSVASLANCLTGCKLSKVTAHAGGCIKLAEVNYSIHVVLSIV